MVTSPPSGTPAAPIAANVAVILFYGTQYGWMFKIGYYLVDKFVDANISISAQITGSLVENAVKIKRVFL